MLQDFLTRQWDILPPDKTNLDIRIVGAGAIGSQTAMCLAKMGFEDITVYDFDVVDEENINCQWYGPEDIGKEKVSALSEHVERLTGVTLDGKVQKVEKESPIEGNFDVLIAAVDSMAVRLQLWERYKDSGIEWFIDPRMAAEEGLVYLVDCRDSDSQAVYADSLYTDDEAVSENCTAKATMYCAMMLAGQVAKFVKDIAVESEKKSHTIQWNIREDAFLSFGRI